MLNFYLGNYCLAYLIPRDYGERAKEAQTMTQREILAAVEAAAKAAAEAAEAAALAAQAAAEAAEALVAAEEAEVAAEALSETEAVQYSLEKRIHEKLKKMG